MDIPVIARFEKVSFDQFKKDWLDKNPTSKTQWSDDELKEIYDGIKLPKRGTDGSAGYDVFAPIGFEVPFGEAKVVPTGIRCIIENGFFFDINPRSGQGFNYGLHLANTRGIIDSDYHQSDNEGHIMVKIVNDAAWARKDFTAEAGKGFAQGILSPYYLAEGDEASGKRNGGFGSTDRK